MSFFARKADGRVWCGTRSVGLDKGEHGILPREARQIAWALGIMGSGNVSVGGDLIRLVDAFHDHWIGGWRSGSGRTLAQWTCADLVKMMTTRAHSRLDNQSMLMAVYKESLEGLEYKSDGPGNQQGSSSSRMRSAFGNACPDKKLGEVLSLCVASGQVGQTRRAGDDVESLLIAVGRAAKERRLPYWDEQSNK